MAEMIPIDRELWNSLGQNIAGIAMPLSAHQQVQQILVQIEAAAWRRQAQAKAAET